MFARLALLFVTVPLVELALLVWLGRRLGLAPTVVLVVVTGILGAMLARHQGLAALRAFRAAFDAGQLPHRELVEGILILLAGAILLTPGLLTDVAGFLLLVPAVRRAVRDRLTTAIGRRWRVPVAWSPRQGAMEVDYRVVEETETPPPRGPSPRPGGHRSELDVGSEPAPGDRDDVR